MALRLLSKGKRLRGTRLDPFGYAHVRRVERELLAQYTDTVLGLAAELNENSYDRAVRAAELADTVRGYEDVKLRSIDRYRERLAELGIDAAPTATGTPPVLHHPKGIRSVSTSTVIRPVEDTTSGVFGRSRRLSDRPHEQVVFCEDAATGLRAIIAIHSTALGPALGGTRFYPYADERQALDDVLRLSRGMTYKAAVSGGVHLGGGKA